MTQNIEDPSKSRFRPVVPILGLSAAIVAFGFFAANDFDRRAIHWGRMQVVLMFVLPPLLGLVLLTFRRLRAPGIAYAAGIGSVAALALALPVGILIIFVGFSTREQLADTFALAGCLPKKLQRGQSNSVAGADGYAFYYYADPPEAGGKVGRFAACARAEREDSGARVIGIDTEGNLAELESPAWKPVASCFTAWAGNDDKRYLNALAACAMSAAALRPGHGYPQALYFQGYYSGACEFNPLEVAPNGRARTERGVIE